MSASSTHTAHTLDLNFTGVIIVFSKRQVRTQTLTEFKSSGLLPTLRCLLPSSDFLSPELLVQSLGPHRSANTAEAAGTLCLPIWPRLSGFYRMQPATLAWQIPGRHTRDKVPKRDPRVFQNWRLQSSNQNSCPRQDQLGPGHSRSDEFPRSCILNYFYGPLEF